MGLSVMAIMATATSSVNSALSIIDKISAQLDNVKNKELVGNIIELQKEFVKIRSEHIKLEIEITKLSEENERLAANTSNARRDEQEGVVSNEEEEILKLLYGIAEDAEMALVQISRQLGMEDQKAKYFISNLENKDFIYVSRVMSFGSGSTPDGHSIGHNGREYLIKNNLV